LTLLLLCFSCNPLYRQYKDLNESRSKSKLYNEELTSIKPILSQEKGPVILIIFWDKNILTEGANLYYRALLYNPATGEKKMLRTTEENPQTIISSNNLSDVYFEKPLYILDNYLKGKEEYLLSFSRPTSAEAGAPYYIYDFSKNKKLRINSFFFDKNGNVIQ
jgi:hypothetical protein